MDLKHLFTSNEEMEELEDQDVTTNIIGYIDAIVGPKPAGTRNELLLKFVLTNGNKRIDVLIWGSELINKYYKEICSTRVIHINGGHCKAVGQTQYREKHQFVPFDIIIKENTMVSFLGYYVQGEETNKLQKVNFDNINSVEGLIEIGGYIRTPFSLMQNRSRSLAYGLGAITNGVKKITIQVKQFTTSQLQIDDFIKVTGTVNGQGSLVTVICNSMNDIQLDSEMEPLPQESILRGGRAVKRIHSKTNEC